MSLKIRDRGARKFRQLRIALRDGVEIDVGVSKKDGGQLHPNGRSTIAEIATAHELGLGVPRRSFLRSWFEENQSSILAQLRAAGRLAFKRRTPIIVQAKILGQQFVRQVQGRIAGGVPPPNAPSTIARKGSATPLVDTGTLMQAISAEVKRVRR